MYRRREPTPRQLAIRLICELYPDEEGYTHLWTNWPKQTPTGKGESWYRRMLIWPEEESERELGGWERCPSGIWLLKKEFRALDNRWFSLELLPGLEEYHILRVLE